MEAVIIIGAVLFVLFALYLVMLKPKRASGLKEFTAVRYAHRGLHRDGAAENSMSAFRLAVERGYGIELDVRLSSDGVPVVFHDDTLDRVTGKSGRVNQYTAAELSEIKLSGTDDGIPTLLDVLSLVSGRVPLLVEIKEDAGDSCVSTEAARILSGYNGPYIVESFNPLSLRNFGKALPAVPLGILSHKYMKYEKYRKPLYYILQIMLLNRIAGVSFVAYDHSHRSFSLWLLRRLFGAVTFAFTVRSKKEEKEAKKRGFDTVIFEGYEPKD